MAVRQLQGEGLDVSPDTLYDWIHAEKLPGWQKDGQWWLDSDGLDQARRRLQERNKRREVRDRLTSEGKTPAAAKKFIQRRLQREKALMEIARELKEGRRP